MTEKAEFAQRLSDAMTRAGYPVRPVVLEREFNTRYWGRSVTLQGVRRWLRGEAIPSQDKLQVLADWLGVEPEVLRFGVAVRQAVQERRQRWDDGIGYVERETFEAFLSLPAPQRKIVREVILTFAKVHAQGSR
jgi:transcriptional regulator with XRE-family HTH domain